MNSQQKRGQAAARAPSCRHRRPARARLTAAWLASLASVLVTTSAALPAAAVAHQPAAGRPTARSRQAVLGGPELAGRGVAVNYPAHGHTPHLPRVPASAFVVADAGTGQVLAAGDPHGKFRPASTLKVLTAITLMPLLSPDRKVRASAWAARQEPSKVGLVAGRWYRISDLFKALLMISANDAAVALAQATGSYRRGMALVNAEARHLRADDTVAKRPNGLDAPGQHVSAYDEALWARAALALPEFMRDEALRTTRFPLRRHHTITLYTQNTMLDTFRGDLGGKIGWTTPAGATFIGWARRYHHTLVVTILHATPGTELKTAATLLSWGFVVDGTIRPVGTLVGTLPVVTARPRHLHPQLARRHPARAAASLGSLTGPIVVGAGTLVAALLLGTLVAALLLGSGVITEVRRSRAAGTRRVRLPRP